MERFRVLWEYLRTSLWLVPSMTAFGAMPLVAFTITIEQQMTEVEADLPRDVYVAKEANALAVLSTIPSSMITMVVLTLAANQFGPRLIRSFMANPQTQLGLGTIATMTVYCLVIFSVVGLRQSSER